MGLRGGGSLHPAGTQDLSSALTVPIIYDITPSQTSPLRHTVGGPPTLGATYTLNANNVPAGSSLGAFVLGFVQINPGIDLSGIGMPGCSQYGTNDNVQFLAVSGSTMTIGLPIPLNAMFAGI